MKVVLYGATGKAGSVILNELVDRGHTVVAAARTPEKVQKLKNVSTVQDDLSDPAKTVGIVKDADAIVAINGTPVQNSDDLLVFLGTQLAGARVRIETVRGVGYRIIPA